MKTSNLQPGESEFQKGEKYFFLSDWQKAISFFQEAADLKYPPAYLRLGICHQKAENKTKAEEAYKKARENFNWFREQMETFHSESMYRYSISLYHLGLYYQFAYPNRISPLAYYEHSAGIGYTRALISLGDCYNYGIGVKKNKVQAVEYYEQAAKTGDPYAQLILGNCCLEVQGITSNHKEAIYWWGKAGKQGQMEAQRNLNGCDVKDDQKYEIKTLEKTPEGLFQEGEKYFFLSNWSQAIPYFWKAARLHRYPPAYLRLGICYERGLGVPENKEHAERWYEKARIEINWFRDQTTKDSNPVALYYLGLYYQFCNVNHDSPIPYYDHSGGAGVTKALISLGDCYYHGFHVKQNKIDAVEYYYTRAAEQKDPYAQLILGRCYFEGEGVTKNHKEAIYWWGEAAKQGQVDAQHHLNTYSIKDKSIQEKDQKYEIKTNYKELSHENKTPLPGPPFLQTVEKEEIKIIHQELLQENKTPLSEQFLLEAIEKDEISISQEVFGRQSSSIAIIWNAKKYLINLQKNPNIYSASDAEELRKRLMDPEFQHPHVIKFFPLVDRVMGMDIIQKLTKKMEIESKDFTPKLALHEWHRYYEMFEQQELSEKKDFVNEAKAKKYYMELPGICEFIIGKNLTEIIEKDEKNLLPEELKISAEHLDQSLALFRQIFESVLHIHLLGAHGNLNGNNIIVSEGKCILIDIACAIKADKRGMVHNLGERHRGSAPAYLAPEIILYNYFTEVVVNKVDTWSLAVILVQLLARINTAEINIFDLSEKITDKPFSFMREKFERWIDKSKSSPNKFERLIYKSKSPVDLKLLDALPSSDLGEKTRKLLTGSLQVNPEHRFSVVEVMLYLGYSSEHLDQLIIKNLLLAMRCNNLSMVIEFWKILQNKNNDDLFKSSGGRYFFDILNALDHCTDVEIMAYTISALVLSEKFYDLLIKKNVNEILGYLWQLSCAIYCLQCTAQYSENYSNIDQFFKKLEKSGILESTVFSKNLSLFSLISHFKEKEWLKFEKRGLGFAITVDNDEYLSDELLKKLIFQKNIIEYLKSSRQSEKSLKRLISHGIALFSGDRAKFLCFILEKDLEQFQYLLPHISFLSPGEVYQPSDQKETLLHLSIKKIKPTLFIFFILCGCKDFREQYSNDKTINVCFNKVLNDQNNKNQIMDKYFSEILNKRKTNNNLKAMGRLITLLCFSTVTSPSFFSKIFLKGKIDEKNIDILPKDYTLYAEVLRKYLIDILLYELYCGKDEKERYVLTSASNNKNLYEISEILFIILHALIKLEEPTDRLMDREKCLTCLKFIESFSSQFINNPFIGKISRIYQKHVNDLKTDGLTKTFTL